MPCCLYFLLITFFWCKVAVQDGSEAVVLVLDSTCNFKLFVLQITNKNKNKIEYNHDTENRQVMFQ
jgi:hypothetical protein